VGTLITKLLITWKRKNINLYSIKIKSLFFVKIFYKALIINNLPPRITAGGLLQLSRDIILSGFLLVYNALHEGTLNKKGGGFKEGNIITYS